MSLCLQFSHLQKPFDGDPKLIFSSCNWFGLNWFSLNNKFFGIQQPGTWKISKKIVKGEDMEHFGLIWEELWRIYTFSWDDQMGVEAMFEAMRLHPFFCYVLWVLFSAILLESSWTYKSWKSPIILAAKVLGKTK